MKPRGGVASLLARSDKKLDKPRDEDAAQSDKKSLDGLLKTKSVDLIFFISLHQFIFIEYC
jgi:hypothetical protein